MKDIPATEAQLSIVHLIYTFKVGGAETMLVDIINGQIARGHKVTLLVVNHGINKDLVANLDPKVDIIAMDRTPGSAPLLMMARLNWRLLKLSPDIIHAHHHKFGRLVRVRRNRLLITIHDVNEPMVYCGSSNMVAITDAVEQNIRSRVPDAKVCTVFNGIHTGRLAERPHNTAPQGFRIVQVARLLAVKKGQDILIKALAELSRRGHNNVDVTFIGDGPDLAALTALAFEQGVADRVHFEGLRDRKYIYSRLADFDIMVHPSRYEGFGLTVAEAMAAGLPLAVTEGDGPWEVADKGRLCEAFATDSPAACADAIERIMANYPGAIDRAASARTYVERFDIMHTVDNYLALYRRTIAKK